MKASFFQDFSDNSFGGRFARFNGASWEAVGTIMLELQKQSPLLVTDEGSDTGHDEKGVSDLSSELAIVLRHGHVRTLAGDAHQANSNVTTRGGQHPADPPQLAVGCRHCSGARLVQHSTLMGVRPVS